MSERAAATVLAGFHAVGARLRGDPASIDTLYFDARRRDGRMRELLARAQAAGVRCIGADAPRLQGLSPQAPHQGVVALATAPRPGASFEQILDTADARTLLLLLDGVTDPRNLGACLRTAAAAGAQALIVPRDRSAALGTAAAKAAAGAAEAVPVIAVTNLARAMRELRDAGIRIVGADGAAEHNLYEVGLDGPLAWALGAEDAGLRRLTRENCDALARIPMAGGMQSLNVSVAAGVCLFETVRRRAAGAAQREKGSHLPARSEAR